MQLISTDEMIALFKKDKESLIKEEDYISINILKAIGNICPDEKFCTDQNQDPCEFIDKDSYKWRCKLFNKPSKKDLFLILKCEDCLKISKEIYPELYI